MNILVSFNLNCGRMGAISGLFICGKDELKSLYGKDVYFGEVLGKHSEVAGRLEEKDFQVKSEDQSLIDSLLVIFPGATLCGYNPFSYFEDDDDCEDDCEES